VSRCRLALGLSCVLVCSCDGPGKVAGPSWSRVAANTRGIEIPNAMEGQVVFYAEHSGLRDEVRLIKVEIAPRKLGRLLDQLGLDTELRECATREFRSEASHPEWRLPEGPTVVPCAVGKVRSHGQDQWMAEAFVMGDPGGHRQLVFLRLDDSLQN